MHPIFGVVYVHSALPVNIVSAYEVTHNDKFRVHTYPDGTLDVEVNDDYGTIFYVRWKRRTLMIDMQEITTGRDQVMEMTESLGEYEDLQFLDEESEGNEFWDEDVHGLQNKISTER